MTIFEQASRFKLRFDTSRGHLTAEDLWDLPLTVPPRAAVGGPARPNLNEIAIGLHRQLSDATPVSFVETAPASDPTLQLRFDIVKHVIDVKVAENKARTDAADRAAQKQRIMAIIAEKRDAELGGKSINELERLLAGL